MADPSQRPTKPIPPVRVHLFQWFLRGLLFIWSTVVLGLALNAGATWLTTRGFDATGTPLGWGIQHLPVVFACGGVLLALTIVSGVLGWQRESSNSHPLLSSPTQKNRLALIRRLHQAYSSQRSESLQGAALMALSLQIRKDTPMFSASPISWRMDMPEESSPPFTSIVQAYDDADAGLLILGAPGAGKSILLRQLALELLTRAEQDAEQPVPVIVNLSSWAINKGPLEEWLVDLLPLACSIPRLRGQY
jgi:hypothetical protein